MCKYITFLRGINISGKNKVPMTEPKKELERMENYGQAIFWSFSRKEYQKTNWWSKTASTKISNRITIRTANTVRKIADM